MIFIIQDTGGTDTAKTEEMLEAVPDILRPDQIIFKTSEGIIEANWKIHLESFLEGYHIKPAHSKTFYPFGYDNLNVIEFCGPHSRVTFPFRRIEALKDVAPADRHVSDKLTYLNHLFPNVILAELSHHRSLGILEPLSKSQTKFTTYHITKSTNNPDRDAVLETANRDLEFVNGTGQVEDIEMVTSIQRSLPSNANDAFTFGHFEPAIVHFHKGMAERLAK